PSETPWFRSLPETLRILPRGILKRRCRTSAPGVNDEMGIVAVSRDTRRLSWSSGQQCVDQRLGQYLIQRVHSIHVLPRNQLVAGEHRRRDLLASQNRG